MSLSSSSQTTTIEIKITQERKAILEKAATIEGLNLSEYILKVATDKAEEYFLETEAIALSDKDWQTVISAIDEPPELNDALKAAINRYIAVSY